MPGKHSQLIQNSDDLVSNFDFITTLFLGGGGGGGAGVHSNLGCRHMFFKIVSLLKNCRSEWGKSLHFWKALCAAFSKITKSLP